MPENDSGRELSSPRQMSELDKGRRHTHTLLPASPLLQPSGKGWREMRRGSWNVGSCEEWESTTEWRPQVIYCVSALQRTLAHLLPQMPFKRDTIIPIFLIKRLRLGNCILLKITLPG